MSFELTSYAVPGALGALASTLFLIFAWRRRHAPGAWSFLLLVVAVGVWSAFEALIVCAPELETKLLLTQFQYLGIATAPICWFFFAVGYCGQSERLRGWRTVLVWVVPLATLALSWTGRSHRLLYESVRLEQRGGWNALILDYGPGFIVFSIYSYGLIFASTVIFLWNFGDSPALRSRRLAVVAAPAFTMVWNALYLAKVVPALPVDLTPLGFVGALGIMAFALYRDQFFDIVPLARDAVLDGMPEPVLLIDGQGAIIEANRAARASLEANRAARAKLVKDDVTIVGQPLGRLDRELSRGLARLPAEGGSIEIERLDLDGRRTYDVLVSPITSHGGRVSGRLVVLRDVTERKLVERELLAARERLERANAELALLASTDPLTHLANRRHFLDRLKAELRLAQRRGEPLSLLLFDLDGFKEVNDTFGHPAGDLMLSAIGQLLTGSQRAGDLPGRLGGEEFALLLPATDAPGAALVAEKLRESVEALRVPDEEGREMRITMSGGVVTAPPGRLSSQEVLYRGDQAMYQAKREGKNRVRAFAG